MPLNKVPNRLINEKSPYLLQHAYNPVNWYPWNEEAFSKAKAEDKPIFLSIGYSTCHWCHVMERESFEDEEVAEALNGNFVAIKVDREERPDIDTIYMTVCQALTGHGGWPLTVFLTPDKKPFYAGTYFPKKSRRGMPGLLEVLDAVKDAWVNKRKDLITSGNQIAEILDKQVYEHQPGELDKDVLQKGYSYFERNFDPQYGGFGSAPKFPTPHQLMFLLRYYKLTGEEKALSMVEKTLKSMYLGGIYDHIGFGFARYSTDRQWLVPHFEKMLYDNALLAIAYGEAYQVTGNKFYAKVVEEIFTYVLRDMTSVEGGFYCAEDADSEGVEGKFYTWIPEEIKAVLGEEAGQAYCHTFDITTEGNFEGLNIPNLIKTGLVNGSNKARQKLFAKREERVHPHKDDKILTSWNGLMIAALAFNSRVLNVPDYAKAAEAALEFILKKLRMENGRLMARYRDKDVAHLAYAEDYAFLIWGILELYQATSDLKHLELALELHADMLKYFWDREKGGLYQYGNDAEALFTRPKEIYDGALPSGNSVATVNMLRLYYLTGEQRFADLAQKQFRLFGPTVSSSPAGFTHFLLAVFLEQAEAGEITIVGDNEDNLTQAMLQCVNSRFLPELGVILKTPGQDQQLLEKLLPTTAGRTTKNGKPTAYLCRNFACQAPVTEVEALVKMLI